MARHKREKPRIAVFPCVVHHLTPENPEYHHGFRFRVHDFDDKPWYFVREERMYKVLSIHTMLPVTSEEMEALRAKGQRTKQWCR